jgi:steroid delta-isomerase
MTADEMINKVQQLVNGVNNHDIGSIIAIYDDEAVVEDPVGTDPRCGHEAIKDFYQQGFQVKIQFELTGPIRCAGNSAAFPFLATIDQGETKMGMEIIEVLEFNEEGKIQRMRAYWGPENCVQN